PHAELGEHRYEGLPMQFSEARWRIERGAPLVGEHTHDVLTRLLGYSESDLAAMAEQAAI
ncbi:MAG: CoA transferase, partial [Chloroflexi bacterium]|nr:CoA transferase [Chloroflexota bacterium]